MTSDPFLLVHAARTAELRAQARRDALVRIATCCRPSALRRTLAQARTRWSRTACCA